LASISSFSSSSTTARATGTLVRVPSPNRRLEGTRATDAQILRRAAVLVALIFVVGVALLVGSTVFSGSGSSARPAATPSRTPPTAAATTSSAPSPSPTATHTHPKKSKKPTPKPKPRPKPTAAGMESFLGRYLSTVARSPAVGWTMLTPSFRNASGGFASYRGFWETVTRAEPRDVAADPRALTIGYGVTYTRRNGATSFDSTRLRLVFRGGDYFIDGEG
jgi:eukaryotic-like serine/threonine-protein kinase